MKLTEAKCVRKDWGEERWLHTSESYAYKRIFIKAGKRTSLQYHVKKKETNYIIAGKALVTIGDEKKEMGPDEFFDVQPGVVHRIEAITDVILQEASTAEVDDVIRLSDDTNRPNGRIESEHC